MRKGKVRMLPYFLYLLTQPCCYKW
jgi:hypothetical protein